MKETFIVFSAIMALISCTKKSDTITPVNSLVETDLQSNLVSRLNTVFDSSCATLQLQGASASIIIPNKGMWKRAYGFSHAANPINTDMLFGIGSNTKTFTATTILKLQEQGKLNINDTIGRWFNHPYINNKITIKQLMNHTSGMTSYDDSTDFVDAIVNDFQKVWTDDEFYQFLLPANFAPGTSWEYSNTNYVLLGFIINKVTGRPVKDVMREIIFNPARLTKTFFFPFEAAQGILPHFWSGMLTGNLEDITSVYNYSPNAFHSLGGGADGCILSTAYDNSKFWYALLNEKIINKNSLLLMQQSLEQTPTPNYSCGLGLFETKEYNGRTMLNHQGQVPGFFNANCYDTKSKVHITILTNQDVHLPEDIVSKLHQVIKEFE